MQPVSPHSELRRLALLGRDDLYQQLNTSPNGLSDSACTHPHLSHKNSKSTFAARLSRAFFTPFNFILMALAVVSWLTTVVWPSNETKTGISALLISFVLLAGVVLRLWQERKAGNVLSALSAPLSCSVTVRRSGALCSIESGQLCVGDVVVLCAGERVPADLRLIITHDLFLSQSQLTGESRVLEKNADMLPDAHGALSDYPNLALMGTSVVSGTAEGIVLAVGRQTVYGSQLSALGHNKRTFDGGASSVAGVLLRFMAALVPIVFFISGLRGGNWLTSFLFSLSVAVGLVPELLPMVVNACLARGSAAMAKKETIVKNIDAMQGFGGMDVLCVDKTGTLTGDEVVLEYYLDILGNESAEVLDAGYLNSLFHTGTDHHLDRAVLKCSSMPGRQDHFAALSAHTEKLDELPFDYERKFVSILVRDGAESRLLVKGSVREVFARCRFVFHEGERLPIDPTDDSSVRAVVDEMTQDGMKVLAVADKPMAQQTALTQEDEHGLTLLGYLVFFDAPKPSAAKALEKLAQLHVPVKVLTGDHRQVALSVCRRLGLEADHVVTGEALERMSEDELLFAVEHHHIFAELSPVQKGQIVRQLHANGHTVGFLGDGVNDVCAMTCADTAISVDTAAPAAREAADALLLKKDLGILEQGILEGRKAFSNMSKYVRITASSNFGNIFSVVLAGAFLPFLPMTATQLLVLNLLYDLLCITLPWDSVDEADYRFPSTWSGTALGRFMRFFGPISSLFDLGAFAFLYFVLCPWTVGGSYGALNAEQQHAFTMLFHSGWFIQSLWTQVLILHLLRTRHVPFFQSRASGALLFGTLAGLSAFTAVLYTPAAEWLGLTALPAPYFLFLAVSVTLYLFVVSLAKRRYLQRYHALF